MKRAINSLCKALALLIPTFLCLYLPIWYAFNLFLATSLSQEKGLIFGLSLLSLVASLILYLIFIGLWRLILKVFWSKPPTWLYPQSWKSVFTGWAIASLCLIIAIAFEPKLWDSPRLLLEENSYYLKRMIEETLGKIMGIWLFAATSIYFIKK